MGYNTDDLPLASPFEPLEGEANFGPPLTREVVKGAHIAPQCITLESGEFVLVDWTTGLPRHDSPGTHTVRFPHGLILFGETVEECARRLVRNQLGMDVVRTSVIYIHSSVDDMQHWHLEPLILTTVSGVPAPPSGASVIRSTAGSELPKAFRWADKPPFEEMFALYIEPRLDR